MDKSKEELLALLNEAGGEIFYSLSKIGDIIFYLQRLQNPEVPKEDKKEFIALRSDYEKVRVEIKRIVDTLREYI